MSPEPTHSASSWRESAACRGQDSRVFFPLAGGNHQPDYRHADTFCQRCEVRIECLEDAIESHDDQGFRGGMRPKQRAELRRSRKRKEPRIPSTYRRRGEQNLSQEAGDELCQMVVNVMTVVVANQAKKSA